MCRRAHHRQGDSVENIRRSACLPPSNDNANIVILTCETRTGLTIVEYSDRHLSALFQSGGTRFSPVTCDAGGVFGVRL